MDAIDQAELIAIAHKITKCDEKAANLRSEGNKLYQQSKFFEALLKYNESLCVGESHGSLSLAYANRSAVFFELKLYEECIENIKQAKDCGYPMQKMPTLDDREKRCLEAMMAKTSIKSDPTSDHSDFFKLSYPANKKIPFIIDGLQMEFDTKYGRKIITNRPLKVGDIISLESPFFGVIQSNLMVDSRAKITNKFNYCDHCLSDNLINLIPCGKCVSVMHCDENCSQLGNKYHQHECFMSRVIQNQGHHHLAIRFFFKALAIAGGSIKVLKNLFNECLKSPKTIFDFDLSNPKDSEYEKNQLRVALSLARDESRKVFGCPLGEKFFFYNIKHLWESHEGFIKKFLLHVYQIQVASRSEIWLSSLTTDKYEIVGRGIFLLGAYINHSCSPNVSQYFVDGKMCLVAVRPIEKGEHLVDSYIRWFHDLPKDKRQEILSARFVCECEACQDPLRFSLFSNLKVYDMELYVFAKAVLNLNYSKMKRDDVIKLTNTIKEKMQDSFSTDRFPSQEYVLMHDALNKFTQLLARRDNYFKSD